MRIAFLLTTFPNVYEPYVVDEIVGLRERGCEVKIFAMIPTSGPVHPLVNQHGLVAETEYLTTDVNKWLRLWKSVTVGSRMVWEYENPWELTHLASSFDLLWRTVYIHDQFEHLRSGYFDVVYCQPGWLGVYAWPVVLSSDSKLVVRFHGLEAFRGRNWGPRTEQRYASLMRAADRFITPSEYLRGRIIELGAPQQKVTSVPRAVAADRFRWSARRMPADGPVRLISVGRLSPEKGHIHALKALEMLAPRLQLNYTIVGDGPLRDELTRYVAERLDGIVTFTGAVDRDAVNDLLSESHIFVAPSVTHECGGAESAGTMIREAAVSGLPVIASDVGGISEAVFHGKTGLLVPEKSPAAIAEAISDLIDRSDEWPEMSKYSHEMIRTRFALATQIDHMLEIFENLGDAET